MNKVLNKHLLAALCATPLLLGFSFAQADEMAAPATEMAAPAEPTPDYTLTYNLGLYSEYMFRGVELSDGPAIQGGIDWAHSSGFYVGTWWSNIDPVYNSGNHVESDFYAGYAHTFDNGIGLNFLGNYYAYLEGHQIKGTNSSATENSFEASAAISYKWLTYTYYRVLTDYYGARDTKGAEYHEIKLNYALPIGDLNFMTKVGYQKVPHLHDADQGDFAIGLNRDFSLPTGGKPLTGFNAGGYYTHTFAVKNQGFYMSNGRDINEDKIWFYAKRTW